MDRMYKYPRTPHLEGSGLQRGDEDVAVVAWSRLAGQPLIVEEKMDGANSAVSFAPDGQLLLQSRGHYLAGGEREQQFALLKTWATTFAAPIYNALGNRYVMYGEWLYAKHSIFYTDLPHYFLEFDIYDTQADCFLSTERRAALLQALPFVASVSVLHRGALPSMKALRALIGPSRFVAPDVVAQLRAACAERGLDATQVLGETDTSGLMEGLYVKVERDGVVTARYKYVRAGFLQAVFDSGSHWMNRPLLANRLALGASLF